MLKTYGGNRFMRGNSSFCDMLSDVLL